jgi:hypothetical protein
MILLTDLLTTDVDNPECSWIRQSPASTADGMIRGQSCAGDAEKHGAWPADWTGPTTRRGPTGGPTLALEHQGTAGKAG